MRYYQKSNPEKALDAPLQRRKNEGASSSENTLSDGGINYRKDDGVLIPIAFLLLYLVVRREKGIILN